METSSCLLTKRLSMLALPPLLQLDVSLPAEVACFVAVLLDSLGLRA